MKEWHAACNHRDVRVFFSLLVAASLLACERPKGLADEVAQAELTQSTVTRTLNRASPIVFLVVVDDSPSVEADEMRRETARLSAQIGDFSSGWGYGDPAYFDPVDVSLVVVGASDPFSARHPGNTPGLHLKSSNSSPELWAAWAEEMGQAFDDLATEAEEPARLLDGLYRYSALLMGAEEPANEGERQLVAQMPEQWTLLPFVLTTRPDESALPAENWGSFTSSLRETLGEEAPRGFVEAPTVVLGGQPDCDQWIEDAEDEWPALAKLSDPYLFQKPCEYERSPLASRLSVDYGSARCLTPPQTRPDGSASCRVTLEVAQPFECASEKGWLDPENEQGEREPTFIETEDGWRRICEMQQLGGQALVSCQTDPACEDCEPGFCIREFWGDEERGRDVYNARCNEQGLVGGGQIRFTHGSDQGDGTMRLLCDGERGAESDRAIDAAPDQ